MSKSPNMRHEKAKLPLVSAPLAAAVLGISRRQFDRLVESGRLKRAAPRQFQLLDIVPAYLEYLRDGKEASSDAAEARLKYIDAQRRAVEQRTRERAKELLERAHVARVFDAVMVQIGAALEGLPGRMAGELAAVNDPAVIREKLADECRTIRATAAEELSALAARGERGKPVEAPAEAHSGPVGGDEPRVASR